jgi:hypothetical protein
MRNFIKQALTRKIAIRGPRHRQDTIVEISPSEKLLLGIYFAIAALAALTILEIVHILHIGSFSSEIFSAITGLVGTIVGVLVTARGE